MAGQWGTLFGDKEIYYQSDVFKKLGGADGRHLEYPDDINATLPYITDSPSTWMSYCHMVIGSYQYRNMPVMFHSYTFHQNYAGYWHGVKPKLWAKNGAPAFKTQKLLGGRAVTIDTIDNVNATCAGTTGTRAAQYFGAAGGAVRWHHRDGYNILYGDGHTKWYGDPQRRIAYIYGGGHNEVYAGGGGSPYFGEAFNLTAVSASTVNPSFYGDSQNPSFYTAQQVWNLFDQSENIDL
jgi:prepilin-type processing-associated H-X9-DG protein